MSTQLEPNIGAERPLAANLTPERIAELNAKLERLTATEIIRWAADTFGDRLAQLTSFQQAGNALCHHLHAMGLNETVDVVFVDTGVNFQETLETAERVREAYGLNLVTLRPKKTMQEQTEAYGPLYLSRDGQLRCCEMRKKMPLQQIRGRYDALLGALRRHEGENRANVPVLAIDHELNLVRVNPLIHWGNERLEDYIQTHNVILNPLHAQGYPTVSCNRCTTPTLPDEPPRAGRWRHLELAPSMAYCNINVTDRGPEYSI